MASQRLQAVADRFSFDLTMTTSKPPVIHGENGISQKAEGPGRASHYISFTRLETSGVIVLDGQRFNVEGESWMDHEFFTHQLAPNQSGWDWFSLQLSDGSEIMLFQLRRKDGTLDPFSAGTYIDPQGRSTHLSAKDFSLAPGKIWASPNSGGRYPIEWSIRVPSLDLERPAHHSLATAGTRGQDTRRTHLLGGFHPGERIEEGPRAPGPRLSGNDRLCRTGAHVNSGAGNSVADYFSERGPFLAVELDQK